MMREVLTIAKRLEMLRIQKGLSQLQLADQIGVSRGSISYYETGQRTPNIQFLIRVANLYGVSLDYLCGNAEYLSLPESERMKTLDALLMQFEKMLAVLHDMHRSIDIGSRKLWKIVNSNNDISR